MRKIIVGVDLSPDSELAVASAVDRARRDGAEVVLVMADAIPIVPEGLSPRASAAAKTFNRELGERLAADRKRLAELRERWQGQGAEISQLVIDGYPDEELPRVAADTGADLIVVGSHGRTGIKRILLGSTAERVTRLAGCSVLVVRGSAPSGGYRHIVVGSDFSALAKLALNRAVEVAAPGAKIEVVHCWQVPYLASAIDGPPVVPPYDEMLEGWRQEGEAMVAAVAAPPGVEVKFHLSPRPAAQGLADVAKDVGADLIVVGSHGRRGIRRFLLGSVAEVTARHAPCSTLVAR